MTENYGIFDSADGDQRTYSAATICNIIAKFLRDGIVHDDGNELAVSASDPPAMSVVVGTGTAIVQGRYYMNDADLTLSLDAADPSYPRIDRIVLQLIATPSRRINAVVKTGTAASSPSAPGLTRTSETYEISLAQIAVGAAVTSISSGNITDERSSDSLCGIAAPMYVPSSQLEAVGEIDMQDNQLTGLPAPSADTDATRKSYVAAEIASAISEFGISDIAIDSDKDWNEKSITNVGGIGFFGFKVGYIEELPSIDLYSSGPTSADSFSTTVRSDKSVSGSVLIKLEAPGGSTGCGQSQTRTLTIKKNGTTLASQSQVCYDYNASTSWFSSFSISATTSLSSGDVITFESSNACVRAALQPTGSISATLFPIISYEESDLFS